MAALLAAVVLTTGGPGLAADAPPQLVDRVVAVVRLPAVADSRIVTLSEVEAEARVALVGQGGALAAEGALDEPVLRAGFTWLVDQLLLDGEASRLQVFELTPADVQTEVARFQGRFDSPGQLRRFLEVAGLDEQELALVLGRSLRVARYLESRVAAAGRMPGEEAAVRPQVGAGVQAEVRALVRELRRRAEVRVLDERFLAAARSGAEAP